MAANLQDATIRNLQATMADSISVPGSADISMLPSNLTLLISNLNSFVPIKLDSTNYIIWKSQFQNILRATKLLGFVDGSVLCPSSTIQDADGNSVPNPVFTHWITIDAHLLSCITATLSPSIFTSVLHCGTSTEVWNTLATRFTSLSRSHIHQLKNKLNHLTKKNLTMEDY